MTNHNPTITSSAANVSFSETSNTTNSSAAHVVSGTMSFKDSDKTDTHTTSASLRTAVWSGGSAIPTLSLADLTSAMSSHINSDSNGSGSLGWTFSAADRDFDFLAKNETLVLTYDIWVTDNHGGSVKQTVKVTVTGTDDKPVINLDTLATVSEQDNHTLSLSPDTAHVAIQFTDADLNNTGHTASVTGVSAAGATDGLLPGLLGDLELMSFFHVDNVVKLAGSSNGTINATFQAPDLAFDYLSEGQTLEITYTIRLDDHAGNTTTKNVIVTVVGSNDAPAYVSGPDTEHLTEGQHLSPAGDLTACGDLFFGDIDLADTHTVSTTVSASRSGGGAIPLSNADLLAALSTSLDDSDGHLVGEIDWNFALANNAISFLSAGEVLTLTYHIIVTDDAGGSDTQTVTITILGTNHPVAFTSGPESASLAELADTTGSGVPDTTSPVPTGTLNFSDQDTGDTHTLTVTLAAAAWSGGPSVPAATQAALASALLTTLHDSTGSGTGGVDWTFSVADNALDFLAAGETLTIDYNVKIQDGSTNSTQTVTVTVTGANDAPVITSGPGAASVAEQPNMSGSSTPDTTSPVPTGTLAFDDVDLADLHSVGVAISSVEWSTGQAIPSGTQDDLLAALVTALHDSSGSGHGGIDWTFSIPDKDLDFLSPGETLTVVYDVTVADGSASSTQSVTITMTGAQDDLVVNPLAPQVAETSGPDDGQTLAVGNLISDALDNAGDSSTTLSIADVNGSDANLGQFIAGAHGTLLVLSDGFYLYQADSSVDPLQVGESATDHFDFTVTDGLGRSVTTTLDINIAGADDAPTVTAAVDAGSVTEDLGPTVAFNGDFETGTLSGWTASSSIISAEFLGIGGELGNYAAKLGPTASSQQLYTYVPTTAGEHYTVSFLIAGDSEASDNALTVTWDGTTILALADDFVAGFTRYSFDVVGNGAQPNTLLQFTYHDDGIGMFIDQVSVGLSSGPPTESADGSVSFADIETGDTHTASFAAQGSGYVGTFSLDPVSEGAGSGSVDWHFTVDNADIQFLAKNQSITQTYTVFITDDFGASAARDVTVTLSGANDAPTAVDETVITDVGADGTVGVPAWALAVNDTDPDTIDTITANSILGSSGGSVFPFGYAFFTDDSTPGGSFTYDVTDGTAVSGAATATIVNNATSATALTGTSGDDIIIATNGGETLSGGGGTDVLIGNAGAHLLTGGSGDDYFAFELPPDGLNTITDFNNTSEQDVITIAAGNFGGGLTAGMDVSTVFESSDDSLFASADSRFHYDAVNDTLYFSADGTDAGAIVVAQLQAGVALHANDIHVV